MIPLLYNQINIARPPYNHIKAARNVRCCGSLTADYTPATAQRTTKTNLNVLGGCRDGHIGSPSDTESQRALTAEQVPCVASTGLSATGPCIDLAASTCQIAGVLGMAGRTTERPAVNRPPRIPKG